MERAAVGSTPCCSLSADTGISMLALARPGLLAVTVIELAAAPLPAALCAVSTSIEASRARSAAVPVPEGMAQLAGRTPSSKMRILLPDSLPGECEDGSAR